MNNKANIESYRSLSAVFGYAKFRNLLESNDFSFFTKKHEKFRNLIGMDGHNLSLSNFFSYVYNELLYNYPNEYIIKNTVINTLLKNREIFEESVTFDEFRIGKSIADLVFVNGEVKVFEIKSDLDNLNRLDSQLFEYSKIAGKVNIVAGEKNISQIMNQYQSTCYGIYEFKNNGSVIPHKKASFDNSNWDYKYLFKLLRKSEYSQIIYEVYGFIPDVPNTKFFGECLELCKKININEFHNKVFNILKQRNKIDYTIYSSLPVSIKLLVYTQKLTKHTEGKLFNLLKEVL